MCSSVRSSGELTLENQNQRSSKSLPMQNRFSRTFPLFLFHFLSPAFFPLLFLPIPNRLLICCQLFAFPSHSLLLSLTPERLLIKFWQIKFPKRRISSGWIRFWGCEQTEQTKFNTVLLNDVIHTQSRYSLKFKFANLFKEYHHKLAQIEGAGLGEKEGVKLLFFQLLVYHSHYRRNLLTSVAPTFLWSRHFVTLMCV